MSVCQCFHYWAPVGVLFVEIGVGASGSNGWAGSTGGGEGKKMSPSRCHLLASYLSWVQQDAPW